MLSLLLLLVSIRKGTSYTFVNWSDNSYMGRLDSLLLLVANLSQKYKSNSLAHGYVSDRRAYILGIIHNTVSLLGSLLCLVGF